MWQATLGLVKVQSGSGMCIALYGNVQRDNLLCSSKGYPTCLIQDQAARASTCTWKL
jgi:hypothetical protein